MKAQDVGGIKSSRNRQFKGGRMSRAEEENMVDDAILKADINFLYGLLEKAKIEREEHLAIIARMRALIATKDNVLAGAVKARNKEKRLFEAGLLKEREEFDRKLQRKQEIVNARSNFLVRWTEVVTTIAADEHDNKVDDLKTILDDTVGVFPECKEKFQKIISNADKDKDDLWDEIYIGKLPTPPNSPGGIFGGRKSLVGNTGGEAKNSGPSPPRFAVGDKVVARAKTGLASGIITRKNLGNDGVTYKYKIKLEEGMEAGCEVWLRANGVYADYDEANGIKKDPIVTNNTNDNTAGEGGKFNIDERVVARVKTGLAFGTVVRKALSGDGVTYKYKIKLEEGPNTGSEMWLKEPGVFASKQEAQNRKSGGTQANQTTAKTTIVAPLVTPGNSNDVTPSGSVASNATPKQTPAVAPASKPMARRPSRKKSIKKPTVSIPSAAVSTAATPSSGGGGPIGKAKYKGDEKVLAKVEGKMKKGVLSEVKEGDGVWLYKILAENSDIPIWIKEQDIKTTMK